MSTAFRPGRGGSGTRGTSGGAGLRPRAPARPAVDHVVRVNGLRLHYRELGDPAAPAVLMVHGVMGHSREWDTLLAALAPGFRVLAVDQRGHGASDRASDYSAAALADDLGELIVRSGAAPVRLLGHSLGGMAALLLAARRSDLVERLVVIDIGPETLRSGFAAEELPAVLAAMAEASYRSPQEAVEEWLAGDPYAREPLLRHYVEHCLVRRGDGRLGWRFDAAGLARQAETGFATESQLWSAVDRVCVPTLLVRGEHSPLLSRDHADRVVQRLEHGRGVVVHDGAHDLGVQQPETVAALVGGFLRP
ncbi:alpha/beta fold hydrolase [Pseudonocardia sp. RS010]|uniref:alpha/beta fold hydrolase n=1 Tax=Pseudonocardia sp. RS010 TaxID=3385979 RepID=UPI0039A0746A